MGCKQAEACQNNKKNNFMGDWFAWQCHPGARYKVIQNHSRTIFLNHYDSEITKVTIF